MNHTLRVSVTGPRTEILFRFTGLRNGHFRHLCRAGLSGRISYRGPICGFFYGTRGWTRTQDVPRVWRRIFATGVLDSFKEKQELAVHRVRKEIHGHGFSGTERAALDPVGGSSTQVHKVVHGRPRVAGDVNELL